MSKFPDFAMIAREVKTVRAGCCDCEYGGWTGESARGEALNHGKTEKHFIWIEGVPKE